MTWKAIWLLAMASLLVSCLTLHDTSAPRTVDPMVTLTGWYDGVYSTRGVRADDLTE